MAVSGDDWLALVTRLLVVAICPDERQPGGGHDHTYAVTVQDLPDFRLADPAGLAAPGAGS